MRAEDVGGWVVIAAVAALVGCGGDVQQTSSGASGAGGASTSASSSMVSTSDFCDPSVCGQGGASASSGAGGGSACGGKAGIPCADTEYCDFATKSCGNFDDQGVCKPRPEACDKILQPACACDGTVYDNPCMANQAGQDLSNAGGCAAPNGEFGCGSGFCLLDAYYCQKSTSDVGGTPDSYSCVGAPGNCGMKATCACLSAVPCGNLCQPTADGGILVTCPGG